MRKGKIRGVFLAKRTERARPGGEARKQSPQASRCSMGSRMECGEFWGCTARRGCIPQPRALGIWPYFEDNKKTVDFKEGNEMLRQLGGRPWGRRAAEISLRGGKFWPQQATWPLEIHFRTVRAQRGESFLLHTPVP